MNEKIINYVYDDHENEFDETVNSYDLEFINNNNAETENDLIDNNNEETEDKLLELFNKAIVISFKTNLILLRCVCVTIHFIFTPVHKKEILTVRLFS